MSRTRFRLNSHSIVAWMSRNSLLQTGANLTSVTKWLSVRLRTKWLWVWVQLQSLKLQISRLFWARSYLTFKTESNKIESKEALSISINFRMMLLHFLFPLLTPEFLLLLTPLLYESSLLALIKPYHLSNVFGFFQDTITSNFCQTFTSFDLIFLFFSFLRCHFFIQGTCSWWSKNFFTIFSVIFTFTTACSCILSLS